MVDFNFKSCYNMQDLTEIIRILRAPGGCPWDAEQTHESIKKNLIEESYEVIEAINKCDNELLCEELGDLLMQIVLHSQMETEKGTFNFDSVTDGVCKKLIIRHPHVFGDVTVDGVEEVLTNWDAIKRQTKGQKTTSESMFSVPRELPALMRATKLQKKAADIGFDWTDVGGALDKLEEEIAELREAIANKDSENAYEELGDVLFSAVNVSRFIRVDAEESLASANDKFLARFTQVEKLANERGIDMKTSSIDVLDALWDEVKAAADNN
ncbi:MAG: nucleoside triphosphate pyrophosphohydrolase [Clostridia bacterium]|nr:nucleoside triphosphate pyrophosphohydrolase [Clostridia bacterium]